jgi:hypothetical protein
VLRPRRSSPEPTRALEEWRHQAETLVANCQKKLFQRPKPRPRLRGLEFLRQPRRGRVCRQSRKRRNRLQTPIFPHLWPRSRCEAEYLDNRQRQEFAVRARGFVRLSSRFPHERNLPPATRAGSGLYRVNRAACAPRSAADHLEKSLQGHSSRHAQIHSPRCDPKH